MLDGADPHLLVAISWGLASVIKKPPPFADGWDQVHSRATPFEKKDITPEHGQAAAAFIEKWRGKDEAREWRRKLFGVDPDDLTGPLGMSGAGLYPCALCLVCKGPDGEPGWVTTMVGMKSRHLKTKHVKAAAAVQRAKGEEEHAANAAAAARGQFPGKPTPPALIPGKQPTARSSSSSSNEDSEEEDVDSEDEDVAAIRGATDRRLARREKRGVKRRVEQGVEKGQRRQARRGKKRQTKNTELKRVASRWKDPCEVMDGDTSDWATDLSDAEAPPDVFEACGSAPLSAGAASASAPAAETSSIFSMPALAWPDRFGTWFGGANTAAAFSFLSSVAFAPAVDAHTTM